MKKITIFNANNENMQVDVVRYFHEGDNKYFIFSLHEIDAQGHMNIYVTKIVSQNGNIIGTNIIDDVEWTNLKTNLQRIIKENRSNGNAIVNDLSINELKNVKVLDRRALKLLATSVDMLNMGYKIEEKNISEGISEIEPKIEQTITNQMPENVSVQNPQIQQTMQVQENDLSIFSNQTTTQSQNQVQNNTNNHQQVASVNNSISENYKDLYFKEKENNSKLVEENNKLINELNSYKMMISDIKNILSR